MRFSMGSLVFLADLIRLIPFLSGWILSMPQLYGESTFPTTETINRQFKIDIEGKHVLVIDDIADTGSTFERVLDDIRKIQTQVTQELRSFKQIGRRRFNIQPEYSCFDIGDDFVVGYGLDYSNKYRNLPFIAVLKDECYRREGII